MKWWQRYLSYFTEVSLERTSSPQHDFLQVSAINGRLQLSTHNSIYSFDDLYLNFYKAFSSIDLPAEGSEVLVLGLGLGSIPWMLERNFEQSYRYVAVDVDEEVIRLASKYRLPDLASPIEIHHTDACRFLDRDQRKFDLICVDVFLDDQIPEPLQRLQRLQQLHGKLTTGGLLLWNWLYRTGTDKLATKTFYEEQFRRADFGRCERLDVGGNWVLVGYA